MNISQPVASFIGGVDFGLLSAEDVKAISVKQIRNPVTFDSLLHPIPGGLYDPALGAFGDNAYVSVPIHQIMLLKLVPADAQPAT